VKNIKPMKFNFEVKTTQSFDCTDENKGKIVTTKNELVSNSDSEIYFNPDGRLNDTGRLAVDYILIDGLIQSMKEAGIKKGDYLQHLTDILKIKIR